MFPCVWTKRTNCIVLFTFSLYMGICQSCDFRQQTIIASTTQMEKLILSQNTTKSDNASNTDNCWLILDAGADDLKLLIFVAYNLSCPLSKFYIYDGTNSSSTSLVKNQCGLSSTPNHYSTSQRFAYIEVDTDGITDFEIKLEYLSANDKSGTGCKAQQILQTNDSYGYISSPNFPGTYTSDSNCRWFITNPNGVIYVEVLIADVEDDSPTSCEYDKYQIFDGEYKCENNVLEMTCSEFPKIGPHNITSTGSSLLITFESDRSVNRRGFYLRHKGISYKTSSEVTSTIKSTTLRLIEKGTSSVKRESTIQSTRKTTKTHFYKNTVTADNGLRPEVIYGIAGGGMFLIIFGFIIVIMIIKNVRAPVSKFASPPSPSLTAQTDSDITENSRRGLQSKAPSASLQTQSDSDISEQSSKSKGGKRKQVEVRTDVIRTKLDKDNDHPYARVISKSTAKY